MSLTVQIRGTNGSGKSWCVLSAISRYMPPVFDVRQRPRRLLLREGVRDAELDLSEFGSYKLRGKTVETYPAHVTPEGLWVLGDYHNRGGFDSVDNSNAARLAVRVAERLGPVLCEGSLASWCYQPWADIMPLLRNPFIWAYLDAPLEDCLANIGARQVRRGKPAELVRGGEQIINKHRSVGLNRQKALDAGFLVADVPARRAYDFVRRVFAECADLKLPPAPDPCERLEEGFALG